MPDPSPYFNCGELKPIRINTFPGGTTGGGGGSTQPQDPNVYIPVPRPPRGQNQPRPETWVCTCRGQMENGGCVEESTRECVQIGLGFPPTPTPASVETYSSKAACEAEAFDKFPCALRAVKCIDRQVECPPIQGEFGVIVPIEPFIDRRSCVDQPNKRSRDLDDFKTRAGCISNCIDEECQYERELPGYKCVEEILPCPADPQQTYTKRTCVRCDRTIDPMCIYSTAAECREYCISTSCQTEIVETGYKCVEISELPCDSEVTSEVKRKIRDCVPCIVRTIVRTFIPNQTGGGGFTEIVVLGDPDCIYDSLDGRYGCRQYCRNDECGFKCTPAEVTCIDPTTQQQTVYLGGRCEPCIIGTGNCGYTTLTECRESGCVLPDCKYQCVESIGESCPPGTLPTNAITRTCAPCSDPTSLECQYNNIQECLDDINCISQSCSQPQDPNEYIAVNTPRPITKAKCEIILQSCPTNSQEPFRVIKTCTPCIDDPNNPDCIFSNYNECLASPSCRSTDCIRLDENTFEVITPRPPRIRTREYTYACITSVARCPEGSQNEFRITKSCQPCDGTTSNCIYLNREQCETSTQCQSIECGPIIYETVPKPPRVSVVAAVRYRFDPQENVCKVCTDSQVSQALCPYFTLDECFKDNLIGDPNENSGSVIGFLAKKLNLRYNKPKEIIDLGLKTEDKIYDNIEDIYNFYEVPSNQTTSYVKNYFYRKIFNEYIPKEVFNFLNKYSLLDYTWKESDYANLTLEKISLALREDLLTAFSNLHNVDNTYLNLDDFLALIRKLIVTNKLNEFDPNYYLDLYQKQINDRIVDYKQTTATDISQRVGLGLVTEGAVPADPAKVDNQLKFRILRKKRLNSDINSNIPITTSANEIVPLYLEDAGITIFDQDTTEVAQYVPIGTGDDYFISVTTSSVGEVELPLTTDVGKSWYIPESVRLAALKAFKTPLIFELTASSVSGQHEFVDTYELSTTPTPMYFALDLSTIQEVSGTDPLIDITTAQYKLLTNSQKIQDHITNYGLASRRVNIDYRDPFIHYAKEKGQISLKYNDITFKYFDSLLNENDDVSDILTRSVPLALILVPGCGTKHNPYHSESDLKSFSGTIVTRTLSGVHYFDINEFSEPEIALKSVTTEPLETGLPKQNYGFANREYYTFDASNYTNTYYVNGVYQSTPPEGPIQKPITSKIVNTIIDNLIEQYDPKELKWFDVYSRLRNYEYGDLYYQAPEGFKQVLANGWRGKLIKDVTRNRNDKITYIDYTIIPEVSIPEPIITKENRFNN